MRRNSAFTLTAAYSDDSHVPEGFDRCVGVFEVGPPPKLPPDGSNAKIKVRAERPVPDAWGAVTWGWLPGAVWGTPSRHVRDTECALGVHGALPVQATSTQFLGGVLEGSC